MERRVVFIFGVVLAAASQAAVGSCGKQQSMEGKALERTVPMELSNAGFEDGLSGWTGGWNAAVDEVRPYAGEKSLRLMVPDPMKDPVYVTCKVPVQSGCRYCAACWVRTENVREAPAKMPSVGAGLIVEWLDGNGKWKASGEYACGRFGTTGWRRMACDNLLAPDGAAFAMVYLALRGAGRAWFDEVTFARHEVSLEKLAPANGVELEDNRPLLSWRLRPGVRRCSVELSRDPAFPTNAVRIYEAGGRESFRLPEPLAPGTWYWRVVAFGCPDRQPWTFIQTAAVVRDCTPPQLETVAARVLSGAEPFEVLVREPGTKQAEIVFLGRKATLLGVNPDGVRRYVFAPSADGWKRGLSEGEMILRDHAGNSERRLFWLLNVPKPENTVTVNGKGDYEQSGRKIFPIGIYEVETPYLSEVRKIGFDVVHRYTWEGSQDDVACRAYLDACWKAGGLRSFVGFDRGVYTGRGIVQGNIAHVAHRVGALADHPALFCWYLFDEPEFLYQFVTADRLAECAHLIRTLDPYHPVVMTTWGEKMNEYRAAWDTHWTQAYGNPAEVIKQLDEHRAVLKNASPITLLVACYDRFQSRQRRRGVEPDPQKFERSRAYMRACAFLGYVEGCNGLWWWWFARDTKEFYTAAQSPEAWADVSFIVRELKRYESLLTASGKSASGRVMTPKGVVSWRIGTIGDERTLVAVNTSAEPLTAEIKISDGRMQQFDFGGYEVKIVPLR